MIIINKLKNSEVYLFFRRKRQKKMKKVRKLSLNFFFFLKRFKYIAPIPTSNFFWRTCQVSQSLFFFTFRHKTKKKQQTKQSFRNRKKPLCIEEKLKRLRTKVKTHKINFNSNFFFFNNSFFFCFEHK